MSTINRLIAAIAIILASGYSSFAQSSTVFGEKFEVKAGFNRKDSVLVINYKNTLPFAQLVWVNDFSIAAIFNQSDISGTFLASPITQEIYLVNRKMLLRKNSSSFFLRNDSSELNLYNYKIVDPNDAIEVRLKISNDSLYNLVLKKELLLMGVFSFIDLSSMELLAGSYEKRSKQIASQFENYIQKPNISNINKTINLKDISWQFNRKEQRMTGNGHILGIQQQGQLSVAKMIYRIESSKSALTLFTFENLYRFSNKQIFNIEIALR